MAVVWECGARVCDVWRWSKISSPKHQANMSRWPKVTDHIEERQGTEGRATKVKGHQSHGKGGARSNAGSRMTRTTPKTTTTTQHQTAGGRRGVKWGIERNKKQRWKLTEVNHINQITREGSRKEKKAKTSTQWKAAAEDKSCLIIRKENIPKHFKEKTQNKCHFSNTGTEKSQGLVQDK